MAWLEALSWYLHAEKEEKCGSHNSKKTIPLWDLSPKATRMRKGCCKLDFHITFRVTLKSGCIYQAVYVRAWAVWSWTLLPLPVYLSTSLLWKFQIYSDSTFYFTLIYPISQYISVFHQLSVDLYLLTWSRIFIIPFFTLSPYIVTYGKQRAQFQRYLLMIAEWDVEAFDIATRCCGSVFKIFHFWIITIDC